MPRQILALIGAVAIVAAVAAGGGSEALGAHPFWAAKTGIIGAAIGGGAAIVLAVLRVRPVVRIGLGMAVLAAGYAAARLGADRFAASYAEDALAGKMWFFGWIGAPAGLCLVLAALGSVRFR